MYKKCPECNNTIQIRKIASCLRANKKLICEECGYDVFRDLGLFNGLFGGIFGSLLMLFLIFLGGSGKGNTSEHDYFMIQKLFDVNIDDARLISMASLVTVPVLVYLVWRLMSYLVAFMLSTKKRVRYY